MNRYFVSQYTDGPATRWNVIDRSTQEIAYRFADRKQAEDFAFILNRDDEKDEINGRI